MNVIIAMHDAPYAVAPARLVVGDWAVTPIVRRHETEPLPGESEFNATHIPTGLSLNQLTGNMPLVGAINLVRALADLGHIPDEADARERVSDIKAVISRVLRSWS